MKKILVSDYDNTFYIDDEDIMHNINKVDEFRNKNNLFIIATGRSYYDFNRKLEKYPMKYDYLIINQGATILNSNGLVIENNAIENNIKQKLIQELNLCDQETMFACSRLESRVSIKNNDITKIHKKYETLEEAKKVNEYLNEKYQEYIVSYLIVSKNGISIEIISSKTNKAKAIQKVANIEEVGKKNIFTIGDSYNDIEMIKNFNGYCVNNAKEEIKRISQKQYKSVSKLIEELLGKEE